MGCLLTLCLVATTPVLWFFPQVTTIVVGAGWLLLFLVVYSNNKMMNFTSTTGVLSGEEAELASTYGFYFRMPHASVGISNACAVWQMFSFLWLGFTLFEKLWWFAPIPAVVILICIYLRLVCHPGFFAQVESERYSGTRRGHESAAKALMLQRIYNKIWIHQVDLKSEQVTPK